MLSKEELVELNYRMLGLGEPIDKDDSGYNVPDFYRMKGLSYIPVDKIDDLMAFAMIDSLYKYKNRQLKGYSSEIDDTFMYYDRIVPTEIKKQYTDNHLFFKYANLPYLPKEDVAKITGLKPIKFFDTFDGRNEKVFIGLDFDDSRIAHTFKNTIQTEDRENGNNDVRCFYKNTADGWKLYMLPELLPSFLAKMGKSFYPDEELEKILVDINENNFKDTWEYTDVKKPVEIIKYDDVADVYTLFVDAYIPELKNMVADKLAHWQKLDNNKFAIKVSSAFIGDYIDVVEKVSICNAKTHERIAIDTSDLKKIYEKNNTLVKEEENDNKVRLSYIKTVEKNREKECLVCPFDKRVFDILNHNYELGSRLISNGKYLIIENCKYKDIKIFKDLLGDDFDIEILPKLQAYMEEKEAELLNPYEMVDLEKLNLPFKPYDFQIEDVNNLLNRTRALIGNDMGTGKTFTSVLVGTSINEKKLVVVPESLRLNWEREIKNVTPNASVKVLYSKDDFETGDDWTIVGYSTASKYKDELLKAGFNCVFVDEAHNCKAVNNSGKPSSQRANAVMELTEQAKYCYLLTGTPIPTSNKDLYNILKMLKVDALDDMSFYEYGNTYCAGYRDYFGWHIDGNSNGESLHNMLSPYMIRRLKKDVLPDLVKQRTFIPVNASSKEYKEIEDRMEELEGNDTFMGLAMTGRRLMSEKKVNDVVDLANSILSSEESVVIATEFTDTVDKLKEIYGDNCCTIVGGMSDSAKQQAIDDFQNGTKKVCVMNVIAGGVGVTLTKAHNMIVADFDWTPANMIQVEDRICRAGQENMCNIYYIYGQDCVLDKYFVDMITSKNGNIDLVVDKAENGLDLSNARNNNSTYLNALKEMMQFRIECNIKPERKSDEAKILRLSKLNNIKTFEDDVKKILKNVKSDKTLNEWNKLIDLRRTEINEYHKNMDNKEER